MAPLGQITRQSFLSEWLVEHSTRCLALFAEKQTIPHPKASRFLPLRPRSGARHRAGGTGNSNAQSPQVTDLSVEFVDRKYQHRFLAAKIS